MEIGLAGPYGQSVIDHVVEELSIDQDVVLIHFLRMVDYPVEILRNNLRR